MPGIESPPSLVLAGERCLLRIREKKDDGKPLSMSRLHIVVHLFPSEPLVNQRFALKPEVEDLSIGAWWVNGLQRRTRR